MAGFIVFAVIVWLVIGAILAFAPDTSDEWRVMAFFWPITLPIALLGGAVYALVLVFKTVFGWFRGEV